MRRSANRCAEESPRARLTADGDEDPRQFLRGVSPFRIVPGVEGDGQGAVHGVEISVGPKWELSGHRDLAFEIDLRIVCIRLGDLAIGYWAVLGVGQFTYAMHCRPRFDVNDGRPQSSPV